MRKENETGAQNSNVWSPKVDEGGCSTQQSLIWDTDYFGVVVKISGTSYRILRLHYRDSLFIKQIFTCDFTDLYLCDCSSGLRQYTKSDIINAIHSHFQDRKMFSSFPDDNPFDRSLPAIMVNQIHSMRDGTYLVRFPEGTRGPRVPADILPERVGYAVKREAGGSETTENERRRPRAKTEGLYSGRAYEFPTGHLLEYQNKIVELGDVPLMAEYKYVNDLLKALDEAKEKKRIIELEIDRRYEEMNSIMFNEMNTRISTKNCPGL